MSRRVCVDFYEHVLMVRGHVRPTLLVRVTCGGREGWGEIAPLQGWSVETFEEAHAQVYAIKDAIEDVAWHCEGVYLLRSWGLYPSVHFGIESALLEVFSPLPPFSIPVAALFMGSFEEMMAQMGICIEEGFTEAKVKIGALSYEEAVILLEEMQKYFRLRVDVNRMWEKEKVQKLFSIFPRHAFSYVEEPGVIIPHLVAYDESFREGRYEGAEILIYKPTLQGGLAFCLPIVCWAQKRGIKVVLSSVFESGVGLVNIATLAARLSLVSMPLGIGTYRYTEGGVSFSCHRGFFHSGG